MPAGPASDSAASADAPPPVTANRSPRWYDKLVGLLFAILCFEMGIFLLAFPWSQYWTSNYFSWFTAEWRLIWLNPYLRGAVSGLGLVNLYLSMTEVFRLQGTRTSG